jgi:uncharacterized protein YceH (UPF0502 family)
MLQELSFAERRVLGVLIEKGFTTPDQYPLTLNSVVVGSNQKSCRDPVSHVGEETVLDSLDSLRQKGFVICVRAEGSRADRWKHRTGDCLDLDSREVAVLAELLLRGPQTDGELRQRASRMVPISDLSDVEEIIARLGSREEPLIQRLGPPGKRRGIKYAHTLYPADEQPWHAADRPSWSEFTPAARQAAPSSRASVSPSSAVATEAAPQPFISSAPEPSLQAESPPVCPSDSGSPELVVELRERIRKLEDRVEELEATFVKFLR